MTTSTSTMPGRGARLTAIRSPAPATASRPGITFNTFVARYRTTWLRDAEATLTTLDWRAYAGGRTLHVLDARAIGGPPRGYLGFTAGAHLHELAGDLLPSRRSTVPVAAVAVNVEGLTEPLRVEPIADYVEAACAGHVRGMIAAVAGHELAHVVAAQVAGEPRSPTATLRQVLDSLSDGRAHAQPHSVASHGPQWVRAFAHLVTRAARLPHYDRWVAAFERDVRHVLPHPPGDYLDALHSELARFTVDDLLADVLRTPAPAGFLTLFDARDAAPSAA